VPESSTILTIGIDASQVVSGSATAQRAIGGLEGTASRAGRTGKLVSRDFTSLGTALYAVGSASHSAGPAMRVMSTGMQAMGAAVMGGLNPLTILLSLLPLATVAIYEFARGGEEAKKATDSWVDSLSRLEKIKFDAVPEGFKALSKESVKAEIAVDEARAKLQRLMDRVREPSVWQILGRSARHGLGAISAASVTASEDFKKLNAELRDAEIRLQAINTLMSAQAQRPVFVAPIPKPFGDVEISGTEIDPFKPKKVTPFDMSKAFPPSIFDSAEVSGHDFMSGLEQDSQIKGAAMAQNISGAFQSAFQDGEFRFDAMLQNLFAQLASSAFLALILSIFNPGKSFGGILSGIFGFQHGTPFVDRTGVYMLHRGEAVIPASQNVYGSTYNQSYMQGANMAQNITIVVNNADPRVIAKELELMSRRRQAPFALLT